MLDYKLLEALAAVLEEGGFEKAAQRLHLTQSAISQRVRQLEERSGQILLSRSTPPRATTAGEQLLKHYRQVKLLEESLETAQQHETGPTSLQIGINADSLASWFLDALAPLLSDGQILIDLHVDDQEQTHRLLREGVVVGCISDEEKAMQGCRVDYLGSMAYRLLATPDFKRRWFADGLNAANCSKAPAVLFNRKDNLHRRFLNHFLGNHPPHLPRHYVPAPDAFMRLIAAGCAYGMIPDWQGQTHLHDETLVEIHPGATIEVKLYWHRWNLDAETLEVFSRLLITAAQQLLDN